MTHGEFFTKVTMALLLCEGWVTSGPRGIRHNAEVGGVWTSLHQVGFGINCQLEEKSKPLSIFHKNLMVPPDHPAASKTMGDLFERMCDRIGLLAIDEGDHYHVQPKNP